MRKHLHDPSGTIITESYNFVTSSGSIKTASAAGARTTLGTHRHQLR